MAYVITDAIKGLEDLMANLEAESILPDELTREEYKRRFMAEDEFDDTFRGGWNAYRVAMLHKL